MLVRLERAHREEGNGLIEDRRVAGDAHVVVHDVRQPREIVGESRADATSAVWMPPVLHVALDELARRRSEDMLARDSGLRVHECHYVLQLVSETVRPAALVER